MAYRLALAQTGYPTDGDVVAQAEAAARATHAANAQLLAFPENFMSPHALDARGLQELAQPLAGPFVAALADIAAAQGLWMVFTMSEANEAGGAPYNTAVVVDDTGSIRGSYRKCHLYDAHRVRESDRMTAGASLFEPLVTPFCTLGLGICYDLRFPELTRSAALAGCNLMLFPACWHDGPHKQEHWETLLRARAIENECFVAGVCHAGERFVERSMAVGPLGQELPAQRISLDNGTDQLFVVDIDPASVDAARANMPVFDHRRPELYR